MSQQLTFDTDSLRSGSTQLQSAGTDIMSQFQQLVCSAPAWGADDVSGMCQMVYDAIVQVVQESVSGVSESWSDHGAKLENAATVFDQTEADNASAGTSIQDA